MNRTHIAQVVAIVVIVALIALIVANAAGQHQNFKSNAEDWCQSHNGEIDTGMYGGVNCELPNGNVVWADEAAEQGWPDNASQVPTVEESSREPYPILDNPWAWAALVGMVGIVALWTNYRAGGDTDD